jgi:DnaJ-class molecular chaperone
MNHKKDYYSILNVDKNTSEDDIRKSYKKLALQYHPDKNPGNDEACEKFKEIAEAYGVLGNKEKKQQYDLFGGNDFSDFSSEDPFDVFNKIFKDHIHTFMNNENIHSFMNNSDIFNNLNDGLNNNMMNGNIHIKVHTFPMNNNINSGSKKLGLESSFLKNGIKSLFSMFNQDNDERLDYNKYDKNNNVKNEDYESVKETIIYNKPENIVYNITVSLRDIYNMKKKKLVITRKRKKNGIYIMKKKKIEIPLYGKEVILEKEGNEIDNYKEKGDIIINIFNESMPNFKRINEYDVITSVDLNICDVYNTYTYNIVLPHGEVLNVQCYSLVNNKDLIQKISNKGLPYYNELDELLYGNLYVKYNLKLPSKIDDLIKEINIENKESVDRIDNNDNYIIAYNCDFNEIFSE